MAKFLVHTILLALLVSWATCRNIEHPGKRTLPEIPSIIEELPAGPVRMQCQHHGVWYENGEDIPNRDGCVTCEANVQENTEECRTMCLIEECVFYEGVPCVDSIKVEDQCCEVCPNGRNCGWHGEIIAVGDRVLDQDLGSCRLYKECISGWFFRPDWECDEGALPPPPLPLQPVEAIMEEVVYVADDW